MKAIGEICLLIITGVVGIILKSLVAVWLWGWFVVGTFNVPVLNMAQFIGVFSFLSLFATRKKEDKDKEMPERIEDLCFHVFYALFVWGFGYIIHSIIH